MFFVFILLSISIYAQNVWNQPLCIYDTENTRLFEMVRVDNYNYLLYTTQDEFCNTSLLLQKLDIQGNSLWDNPILISSIGKLSDYAQIKLSSDNKLFIVWNEYDYSNNQKIYAYKYSLLGQPVWNEKKCIADFQGNLESLKSNPDSLGIFITWKKNSVDNICIDYLSNNGIARYGLNGHEINQTNNYSLEDLRIYKANPYLFIKNTNHVKITGFNRLNIDNTIFSTIIEGEYFIDNIQLLINNDNSKVLAYNYTDGHYSWQTNNVIKFFTASDSVSWSLNSKGINLALESLNSNEFLYLTLSNSFQVKRINNSGSIIDSCTTEYFAYVLEASVFYSIKSSDTILFSIMQRTSSNDEAEYDHVIVTHLKYDPNSNIISNNIIDNNIQIIAEDSFLSKKSFIIAGDLNSTSIFADIKYGYIKAYAFNTLNNIDYQFLYNQLHIIFYDKNESALNYDALTLNQDNYYAVAGKSLEYLKSDYNQNIQLIKNIYYAYYPTPRLFKISPNYLLLSASQAISPAFTYSSYRSADLRIYQEGITQTDSLLSFSWNQEFDISPIAIGQSYNELWSADNITGNITLNKVQNNQFFWQPSGLLTNLSEFPVSVDNGVLVTVNHNQKLKIYKFNADGSFNNQWPENGIEQALQNDQANYKTKVKTFLTNQGLLIFWEEFPNYGFAVSNLKALLINPLNGEILWTSHQQMGSGAFSDLKLINDKIYLSKVNYENNQFSFVVSCYSINNLSLTQLWQKQLSDGVVSSFNVKYINNRLVYAYSRLEDSQYKIYLKTLTVNGNNDQYPNGYQLFQTDLQQVNPIISEIDDNQAYISFLGYKDVRYKNLYNSLVDLSQFVPNDDINLVVPVAFTVNSNYPNPFNPSTTISFEIPETNLVDVSIYNIKGQRICQLINKSMNSGHHTINWKGTNENNMPVSSGIYFTKIRYKNQIKTIKMLLLK